LVSLCLVLFSAAAMGQSAVTQVACPDSHFFEGAAYSNVCWSCIFPIRIAGVPFGAGGYPDDAAAPFCVCPGKLFGIPSPGFTLGLWEPTHLIEEVRQPYCSPIMGRSFVSENPTVGVADLARWGGFKNQAQDSTSVSHAYYNFHWWMYPVNAIIDGIVGKVCTRGDSGYDLDIAYLSELDPTFVDDELSLYTTPEAGLFANPTAIAACVADAVAATAYKPIAALYWCAGSWGLSYPFTGQLGDSNSPPRMTSLAAFKGLAAMHRRGLAKRTYGNDAVCAAHIDLLMQKQQYKFQTFFPIPETTSDHWLGENTFRWGEWRNIPYKGEDFVYMQWQWKDCCVTAY
jgi:conjugal transfer pilus assembly protein TraU